MYVWKEAGISHPHAGAGYMTLSDDFLVHLDDGTSCYAYYDLVSYRWCDTETLLPFLPGRVIEWRDKVEVNR